jgi:hypothetical protein
MLTIFIYGVIMIPHYTIIADQTEISIYQIFLTKYSLPLFFGSFFVFAFARFTFFHLRLVNEQAIGREFSEESEAVGTKQESGSLEFIEMEMAA